MIMKQVIVAGTYSVNGVELPSRVEVVEAQGVNVLVDSQSDLDEQVHDHQTLGTNLERQNLDSVGDEQTRPSQRISDGEDPDHGNDGLTSSLALGSLLLRRSDSPDDEGNAHGCGGRDEEWATTNAINEQSAGDGDDERQDGKTTVDTKLGVGVCDTNGVVDIGGVVGNETVARPLGEETKRCEEHKPVPVALGLEEVKVGRGLLVLELEAEGLLDLSVFELNCSVVGIAVGVVLGKDVKGFLVPLLGDQPTWGLGDKPDSGQLDDGRSGLGKGGNTPAPIAVNALGTESQPGANDGTNVPQAVVDGGDTSTMLRMAEFGEQQGRRQLSKRVSETHKETSTHEVVEVLGGGLDGSCDDHDDTSEGNACSTSETIGNEGSDGKRGNGTDGVKSSQETKSVSLGVVEEVLPFG
jgi:hypothetical protein